MSDGRLVFIGGTRRGLVLLRALLEAGHRPSKVFGLEQDAHEQDRADAEVAALAEEHGIPVEMTRRIGPDAEREICGELRPDLILVVGWRTMIAREVVEFPRFGCLGVHDSLLPRGRGFAPTNWTIITGADRGGVTLFHMADDVDAGDIVGQREIEVTPRMTAPQLYARVIEETVGVVLEHLPALLAGTAPRVTQDHAQATFYCARRPEDGVIDWTAPTAVIDRLVRGLAHPYPGATTTLDGASFTVWEAEPVEPAPIYEGRVPGRPVAFGEDGSVDVLTGDGVLRLLRVQRGEGPMLPARDVVRSIRATLGR